MEYRYKITREAAAMARSGFEDAAKKHLDDHLMNQLVTCDFTDVRNELIRAVKPFRPKAKT